MSTLLSIAATPADLGLPPHRFPKWRPIQIRAIDDGLKAQSRFIVQSLCTGAGKSAVAVAQGMLAGRCVYLTATRALQRQLLSDFEACGMVDIRGRSNYECVYGASSNVTCDDGPHLGCKGHREGTCPYVNALGVAKASSLVVTNYSYWMAISKYGDGLGDVDLLVCDEAASAVDEICGMMTVELSNRELKQLGIAPLGLEVSIEEWRKWALSAFAKAATLQKTVEAAIKRREQTAHAKGRAVDATVDVDGLRELRIAKALVMKLETLASSKGPWVADQIADRNDERTTVSGYRFDPLWPGEYAEPLLFCGAPRILLTSATINRKTCRLLGIPSDQLTYVEYPAIFDPRRSPVTWVRTMARVDSRMNDDAVRAWISRLDQIIRLHPNEKGIIHCTSYQRQKDIYRLSGERSRMMWHSSWNTQEKIEQFKRLPSESGMVLLSPAVTTGYDFADDACRWQILAKVPMVDTRSRIMKARMKADPDYPDYLASQIVVQLFGRPMRNEKDWVRNYVIDDHWEWWFPKMKRKGLLPQWFVRMCWMSETLEKVELPRGVGRTGTR